MTALYNIYPSCIPRILGILGLSICCVQNQGANRTRDNIVHIPHPLVEVVEHVLLYRLLR